jgi:methyl-accepting chemotaxis protein
LNSKETAFWREIKDVLQKASGDQQSLFKSQIQGIDSIMGKGMITLIIVIFFSVGGVLLFLFLVGKSTAKNINAALTCLGTLERGELTNECRITDKRNFLKDIYNRIHESLRQTVVNIQRIAKKLTVNTAAITGNLRTIDEGAREQLAQLDHIASASTEMSQTITDVAKNATSASEAAKDATEVASQGKGIVQKSVGAMKSISLSVNDASATIEDLKTSLKEVEDIVSIINDISDQTNLLALNAAIEAARAGEQGRGFSVVADEVRKLAERTGKATEEIAQKLDALRQKSEASVHAMRQSRQDAEKGVEHADATIQALNSIVVAAEKAGGLIQTIAVAAEEQSAASEEIAGNMEKIAASVNGTVSMLANAYKEVEQLDNQAKELDASISFFKLG